MNFPQSAWIVERTTTIEMLGRGTPVVKEKLVEKAAEPCWHSPWHRHIHSLAELERLVEARGTNS